MGNNWNNYQKRLKNEKKAAVKEKSSKKKKIVTYTAWAVGIVLAVAAITVAVILGIKSNKDEKPAETTAPTTTHSHVHNGSNPNITLPEVTSLIPIKDDDMEPLFKSGDVIETVKVKDESELKVGDIIAYVDMVTNGVKMYKVLRINDIIENEGVKFYEVKGDKKEEPENSVVPFSNIVGKFKEVKDISNKELNEILKGSAE